MIYSILTNMFKRPKGELMSVLTELIKNLEGIAGSTMKFVNGLKDTFQRNCSKQSCSLFGTTQ